jgi:uncharacterized damage-inducible protein DinB
MNKNYIELLFEYDRWANARVLKCGSALTIEQFTKDLGGGFRSVRSTLVHIFGGEWIWIRYWQDPPRSADKLSELRAKRDVLFSLQSLPDISSVCSMWAQVEKEQVEFIRGVTDDALQQRLPFRDGQIKLGYLMQHVINHSTYHRGQISLMMRQLGAEPVATDFHLFMAEQHFEAAG